MPRSDIDYYEGERFDERVTGADGASDHCPVFIELHIERRFERRERSSSEEAFGLADYPLPEPPGFCSSLENTCARVLPRAFATL